MFNETEVKEQRVDRLPQYGEAIVYVDPVGKAHQALVTCPHGVNCVNLVYVSRDPDRKDTNGRQIERQSSSMHASVVPVWGNYWRYVDEPAKPTET